MVVHWISSLNPCIQREGVTKQPLQWGYGIEEAAIIVDTRSHLPEPTRVCRNWHHGVRVIHHTTWLPRLHRAGPSTSLDKIDAKSIQFVGTVPSGLQSRSQPGHHPSGQDCTLFCRKRQTVERQREQIAPPLRAIRRLCDKDGSEVPLAARSPGKSTRFPEKRNRWYNPHIAGPTDLGSPDWEQASTTPRRRV
jgi:hypothetical protein